jgi:hypothetical protein
MIEFKDNKNCDYFIENKGVEDCEKEIVSKDDRELF